MTYQESLTQTIEGETDYLIFSRGERHDLIKIGKSLAEYLNSNNIGRIAFIEDGATLGSVCLIEAWQLLYPNQPLPQISFVNPLQLYTQEMMADSIPPKGISRQTVLADKYGADEVAQVMSQRPESVVIKEFQTKYSNLMLDKDSPVMIFDTCQHTGMSTDPVLNAFKKSGFKAIQLGLASDVNNLAPTAPNFVALGSEAHGSCYPFHKGRDKKNFAEIINPSNTFSEKTNREAQIGQKISKIFKEDWNSVVVPKIPTAVPLERLGFPNNTVIVRPLSADLFFAGKDNPSALSPEFAHHTRLLEQAKQRRELYDHLTNVFSELPDVTIEWSHALSNGLITPKEMTIIYQELTTFLQTDPHNARILLYLPFEMLIPESELKQLGLAGKTFQQQYQRSWLRLLAESEYRDNFIEGDIPELNLGRGEAPRVIKAAHLVPELMSRQWLTVDDIISILEVIDDIDLENSIFQGLTATYNRKLLSSEEIRSLQQSTCVNLVEFIRSLLAREPENDDHGIGEAVFDINIFWQRVGQDLKQHQDLYDLDSPFVINMTQGRYAWEKEDRYEKILAKKAKQLSPLLKSGLVSPNSLLEGATNIGDKESVRRILVQSIGSTIEALAGEEYDLALDFFKKHQDFLEKSWDTDLMAVKNDVYSVWAHLVALKIIEAPYLDQFGLTLPKLASLYIPNLKDIASQELRGTQKALELIYQSDEVNQHFYPVFVLSGSKVKGYGTLKSDNDIISFAKRQTSDDSTFEQTKTAIAQASVGKETMLSFTVREENSKLQVVHSSDSDNYSLTADNIQSLLGSIWIGNKQIVQKLRSQLLKQYLELTTIEDGKKEEVRFRQLRNLEYDTLQARLLHRGYRFFYPDKIPTSISRETNIDGTSTFWDPGYKRMATQVFLSKVFLPDLS